MSALTDYSKFDAIEDSDDDAPPADAEPAGGDPAAAAAGAIATPTPTGVVQDGPVATSREKAGPDGHARRRRWDASFSIARDEADRAAPPRLPRGYSAETSRGDAAGAAWIFRGGASAPTARVRTI